MKSESETTAAGRNPLAVAQAIQQCSTVDSQPSRWGYINPTPPFVARGKKFDTSSSEGSNIYESQSKSKVNENHANKESQDTASSGHVGNIQHGECLSQPQKLELDGHSIAGGSYPHKATYFGEKLAAFGPQQMVYLHPVKMHTARIPLSLSLSEDCFVYVNAKQYHAILRRRRSRAKLEVQNRVIKTRKAADEGKEVASGDFPEKGHVQVKKIPVSFSSLSSSQILPPTWQSGRCGLSNLSAHDEIQTFEEPSSLCCVSKSQRSLGFNSLSVIVDGQNKYPDDMMGLPSTPTGSHCPGIAAAAIGGAVRVKLESSSLGIAQSSEIHKPVQAHQEGKDIHKKVECVFWLEHLPKSLSSNFCPTYLLKLNLQHCSAEQLWTGKQYFVNLESVDLKHSKLTSVPDLSEAKRLGRMNLGGCLNLVETSSIQKLTRIEYLNLKGCKSLKSLPTMKELKFLRTLVLSKCSNLQQLPHLPTSLMYLRLAGTAIKELPESIGCISGLIELDLRNCTRLKSLPTSISKLQCLEYLDISGCSILLELFMGLNY